MGMKKKILIFSGAGVILNCSGIYKQTKEYKFEYYEEENFNI